VGGDVGTGVKVGTGVDEDAGASARSVGCDALHATRRSAKKVRASGVVSIRLLDNDKGL